MTVTRKHNLVRQIFATKNQDRDIGKLTLFKNNYNRNIDKMLFTQISFSLVFVVCCYKIILRQRGSDVILRIGRCVLCYELTKN